MIWKNMNKLESLKVKIYADGAEKTEMLKMAALGYISGLTTNPTLMRKAGIRDYKFFAKDILSVIQEKPISFEVFSDDLQEMERQAMEIASWGSNVYVKLPITNTKREPTFSLIKKLSDQKVQLNVTAIMTLEQVKGSVENLNPDVPCYISIFAGRIADTGVDPIPLMRESLALVRKLAKGECIWASPREVLNIFQANEIGCHIITVTKDIITKFALVGYNLSEYSLDTVKMFFEDGKVAGYEI